jgi:hypothetical protein
MTKLSSSGRLASNPSFSMGLGSNRIIEVFTETVEARAALAECNKICEEKLPKPDADLGKDWRDWIIAHALLSEAKRTIDGDSPSETHPASLPQ